MFKLSNNAIQQTKIPKITLANGLEMPAIGMGTFGSDCYGANEVSKAVLGAASIGYRFFDCASVYGNEHQIGEVFQEIMTVIPRNELFINSKVWNDQHDNVVEACKKTLRDLQLDYLDMYMVHWPFRNHHEPGVSGDARDSHSRPYNHDQFMETWQQMEQLVQMGLVKSIGTSNMTIPKIEKLLESCSIKPIANEMELHPHFQQPELYDYLKRKKIQPIGFCPIGSPRRPERDKSMEDTVDIEDPIIVKAAKRLNVHPALICLKWAHQRGHIPIPFSVSESKYFHNLMSVVDAPLTAQEMQDIAKIDKQCRLIKGQVFLWQDAKSWQDLWDLDGSIAL